MCKFRIAFLTFKIMNLKWKKQITDSTNINIDYYYFFYKENKKYLLSSKSAYQDFWRTEDWSNNAENQLYNHRNKLYFQKYSNRKQL